jgi:hypothetical protein
MLAFFDNRRERQQEKEQRLRREREFLLRIAEDGVEQPVDHNSPESCEATLLLERFGQVDFGQSSAFIGVPADPRMVIFSMVRFYPDDPRTFMMLEYKLRDPVEVWKGRQQVKLQFRSYYVQAPRKDTPGLWRNRYINVHYDVHSSILAPYSFDPSRAPAAQKREERDHLYEVPEHKTRYLGDSTTSLELQGCLPIKLGSAPVWIHWTGVLSKAAVKSPQPTIPIPSLNYSSDKLLK